MGTALILDKDLRLEVPQRALREALGLAAFAAKLEGRSPASVVLLATATDGTVTLTAANEDLRITVCVAEAVVEGFGEVAVSGRLFPDLVGLLPAGPVSLALDDELLLVETAANRSRLVTMERTLVPVAPATGDPAWQVTLPVAAVRELLARVSYASGTEATRAVLKSIYLELGAGQLTATASNGHRLATASIAVPTATSVGRTALLPDSTVAVLIKLLAATAGETLTITRHTAEFITVATPSVTLVTRLVNGPYPSFAHLLPTGASHPGTVLVERRALAAAVERVALLSPMASYKVELEPTAGRIEVAVQSANDQKGAGIEMVAADVSATVERQAFNARYLLDALSQLRGTMVAWRFKQHDVAVVFDETVDGVHARHLLMPLRADPKPAAVCVSG
jgi:DNA polymerase-3 subunit beta